MLAKFTKTILQTGSKIIGRVRLADITGKDITEDGNIKAKLQPGEAIIGRVGLVDEEGEPFSQINATLLPGDSRIGTVSGVLKTVTAFKVLVGGVCSAEDVLSESTTGGTPWTFPGMARKNGGTGYIVKAFALLQTTALTPRLTIFLFRENPTSALNDNVANTAVILADRYIFVGQIDLPAMEDLGGMSGTIATPSTGGNLPLAFECSAISNDLKGIVVARDAVTPTALDLLFIGLTVELY